MILMHLELRNWMHLTHLKKKYHTNNLFNFYLALIIIEIISNQIYLLDRYIDHWS